MQSLYYKQEKALSKTLQHKLQFRLFLVIDQR